MQAVRIVSLLAIARLLTPREFGLAALALAFWAVISVVADLPLAAALVQHEDVDDDDRSTAFWAATAWSGVLAAAGAGAAGAVAAFLGEDEVAPLVAALAVGVLLGGLTSTPAALLTRALEFRVLELVSFVAVAAGAAAGVALAAAGAGPWALVGGSLVSSGAASVLVWSRAAWTPQRRFSKRSLRRLGGFASLLLATRVVAALQRSADRILVGRSFDASAAGLYAVPAGVASSTGARLVDPVRAVLFPALARLQGSPAELAEAWLRVTAVVVALVAPVLLGLALAAEELLALVLTDRWADSAPVLRVLALAALVTLAGAMNAVVLTALGRLRTVLLVLLATLALSGIGFAIGQRESLEAAAAGWAGAAAAMTPLYVAVTARALGLRGRAVLAVYAPGAAGVAVMTAVALGSSRLLLGEAPARVPHVLLVAAGAAVAGAVTLALAPQLRRDLARALRGA